MTKIHFFDTTLRDGEQTPGVNFNESDKIQIAKQLERWGVDAIEAGFPRTSQGDFEAVQAIARAVKNVTVVGLARCKEQDIDAAYEALKEANYPQIHVFLATSPVHRESKLKMTKEEVLASIKHHVSYAREKFEKVQFSPEDATRTEWDFLAEAVNTAIEAGATIINIPDTVGYTTPGEFGDLFQYLQNNVPKFQDVMFSCHCHDDLGLATANSMAAIKNGATRVEGTVNGIGERAGNAALEEVAVGLHIRKDYYGDLEFGIKLKETKRTSDLISHLAGMPVPRNKAVIGGNAFAHESGIHQDGVLKNAQTYEIITPQLVGVDRNSLPLGKLSGRHAFTERVEELGYQLEKDKLNEAFKKFKDLADKKKVVTSEDIVSIILGYEDETGSRYVLENLQLMTVTKGIPSAIVQIRDRNREDAELETSQAMGNGPIEAIFNAIDEIIPGEAKLKEYRLEAVTEGIDAQAEVHVVVENEFGVTHNGNGVDYDVITASAKAYIQACGRAYEQGQKSARAQQMDRSDI